MGERVALGPRARFALRLTATGFVFGSEDDARRAGTIPGTRLANAVAPLGVTAQRYESVRPAPRTPLGATAHTRFLVCPYDPSGRVRAANVLRVLALLVPRHPDLQLVMLGPGTEDGDLRMHAAALRITKHVTFLGPRDDALSIYALADLGWVVANGDNGAFGALDLMGSRVPVIAERGTPAQLYVPDGIAGLLLPPGGAHEAAAAIARLLAHEEQRSAMGAAGRTKVARDHSETAMVEAFERAAALASDRAQW
ncbi:MAG: glycosyltransferase [Gemmatimonadaceae bacterium]|nr:glycosyltransferase [Gemmatimonadaceae bacterium]